MEPSIRLHDRLGDVVPYNFRSIIDKMPSAGCTEYSLSRDLGHHYSTALLFLTTIDSFTNFFMKGR